MVKVMLCMQRKFFSHNLKHFQRYCKLLKFGLFYPTLHFFNKGVGFAQCQETLDGHSTRWVWHWRPVHWAGPRGQWLVKWPNYCYASKASGSKGGVHSPSIYWGRVVQRTRWMGLVWCPGCRGRGVVKWPYCCEADEGRDYQWWVHLRSSQVSRVGQNIIQYNTIPYNTSRGAWLGLIYSPQVPRDMGCFVTYATVMQVKGVGSNEGSVNKKTNRGGWWCDTLEFASVSFIRK